MFEWIFYPWMISNAYTLLIIYARVDLTPIYSMLVLFTCCWGSDSLIQDEVGNLNRDLLQPSRIRYEVWSFSVRYLISLGYWKGLIFGVKLSVLVTKSIWISLCNTIFNVSCVCIAWFLGHKHRSSLLSCILSSLSCCIQYFIGSYAVEEEKAFRIMRKTFKRSIDALYSSN